MTRNHTNNRMQKKPNDFGLKYGTPPQKKKTQRRGRMDKQYDNSTDSKKAQKRKYPPIYTKQH